MVKKFLPFIAAGTLLFAAWFIKVHATKEGKVDLVVFSYDRPLQLYAFLESAENYVQGLSTVSVIYRTTDDDYEKGYQVVKEKFPKITFLKQSSQPHQDFKPLVMKASFDSPAPYILYGVDDIVVTDFVDLHKVVAALEKTNSYGFYLRLGTHLTECYMLKSVQRVPPLRKIEDDIYAWNFNQAEGDWAYPNSTDMTVYRKKDLKTVYESMHFVSPNSCEGQWASRANLTKQGLCFEAAKIVNIPMNLVQTIYLSNRNMNLFSAKELLAKFNEGLKMDISPLHKKRFKSVHVEYLPTFVKRA